MTPYQKLQLRRHLIQAARTYEARVADLHATLPWHDVSVSTMISRFEIAAKEARTFADKLTGGQDATKD